MSPDQSAFRTKEDAVFTNRSEAHLPEALEDERGRHKKRLPEGFRVVVLQDVESRHARLDGWRIPNGKTDVVDHHAHLAQPPRRLLQDGPRTLKLHSGRSSAQ